MTMFPLMPNCRLALFCWAALFASLTPLAQADRADRSKPLNVSANAQNGNLETGESIFEGNFLATQGSMTMRADRAVIRRDKDGNILATATGMPVTYREKRENSLDYINAAANRVEYDGRTGGLRLIGQARITSSDGEVKGDLITYNSETGAYQVQSDGKVTGDVKDVVRAVILPRPAKEAPVAPPPAAAPLKTDTSLPATPPK
jgi:lipopolysaccharide export system protein LptA